MAFQLINLHLKRSIPVSITACSRNCSNLQGHIIFPTKDKTPNHQNASKPVIFLLSWTGSRDRDLAKYSAIYEERGYTVVNSIVHFKTILSWQRSSILERQAQGLIHLLHKHKLTTQGLFIHLFSNGGFFLYDAINTQLKMEANKDIRLTGCVFDSAPAQETIMRTAQLITTKTPGPLIYKYAVGVTISSFNTCMFWGRWLWRYILGLQKGEPRIWQRMSKEPNICPQLFLFSKADKLIEYRHIQWYIAEREKMGVKTQHKMWEDSDHVAHYKKYPDAYLAELLKFMEICQSQQRN